MQNMHFAWYLHVHEPKLGHLQIMSLLSALSWMGDPNQQWLFDPKGLYLVVIGSKSGSIM